MRQFTRSLSPVRRRRRDLSPPLLVLCGPLLLLVFLHTSLAFVPLGNAGTRTNQRQQEHQPQQQQPRIHSAVWSLKMAVSASKTGGTLIESEEGFAQTIAASEERPVVLAFFTAPWCGPCRLSVPVVKDVMKQFSGKIHCCEICTDDLPEVAADSGVVSIPTIHLYSKGACGTALLFSMKVAPFWSASFLNILKRLFTLLVSFQVNWSKRSWAVWQSRFSQDPLKRCWKTWKPRVARANQRMVKTHHHSTVVGIINEVSTNNSMFD